MNLSDRTKIIIEINKLLYEEGFETSNIYDKSCFDMFARKKLLLLLLKVLVNIDSLNQSHVHEIKKISNTFQASPLVVGLKSKNHILEEDVVYERYGMPTIALETLKNIIIHGEYPEILADRGGYFVQIAGDLLKDYRTEFSLSLKELADLVKVSRETIYNYENNLSRANPETAILLEELLNMKITLDIDVFQPKKFEVEENEVSKNENINDLKKLGLGVVSTNKTPFDALGKIEAKKINDSFITSLDDNKPTKTLHNVAISLKDLSLITGSDSFFIINNEKIKESLDGIPVINSWEIKEIDDKNEFLKLVKERKDN
ncbi:MAG: transcriptional regulator [Methanobrevibacter sp.]|nr:transcriptional regulator [Candidatus Methanoflexus mossambicus]